MVNVTFANPARDQNKPYGKAGDQVINVYAQESKAGAGQAQIKLGNVTGFFQPPKDPAYHLEIPQPAIGEQE